MGALVISPIDLFGGKTQTCTEGRRWSEHDVADIVVGVYRDRGSEMVLHSSKDKLELERKDKKIIDRKLRLQYAKPQCKLW